MIRIHRLASHILSKNTLAKGTSFRFSSAGIDQNKNFDKLKQLRRDYNSDTILTRSDMESCPFQQFTKWLDEAIQSDQKWEANAMVVSTCDKAGNPSSRYVLLKEYDKSGFVFYTHHESKKGSQLAENPNIAALLYFPLKYRQIRIEGKVEKLSEEQNDEYFYSRPLGAQISASVSPQSQVIDSKDTLQKQREILEKKIEKGDVKVPRPEQWGGYRIVPNWFEYYQGQPSRFHDRFTYRNVGQEWVLEVLAP